MNRNIRRYKELVLKTWAEHGGRAFYFMPGAFLIALAFAMVAMPRLFVFFLAGFFLFCGVLFCFIAWRLIRLKKRLEGVMKELSGRVVIHGLEIQDPFDFDQSSEGKKIVYH